MLHTIRDAAEQFARAAGALLLDHAARPQAEAKKSNPINLVTAADKASEAYLVGAIRERFPDHYIHGEEGGGYGPLAGAPYRWYIDPLDGTTNFAHGFPCYSVNLGVTDANGEPVVGVTYDPNLDELFSGIAGEGATVNGRPLRVSTAATLVESLLTTGFPYDSHTAVDNNTAAYAAFVRRTQGVRRAGSAALDLAYVACGRVDGYWENGPMPWDITAGIVLVREAGGVVTNYAGTLEGLYGGGRIVASNGLIHRAMLDVLAEVQASFGRLSA